MSLEAKKSNHHYVLTKLMASFPVPVNTESHKTYHSASSTDVDMTDYFSAAREYADITLRPVLVPTGSFSPVTPNIELLGEGVIACHRHALYHVENHSDSVDHFSLCDALHAALALLGIHLEEDLVFLPIEPSDITANEIKVEQLFRKINDGMVVPSYAYDHSLSTRSSFGYELDDLMWIVATNLVEHDVLLYASLFVRESRKDYQFSSDEVEKTLLTCEKLPDTISEGVKIENAIHNSYKAIEAIHGGNLPQDKKKILSNFRELGIDLTNPVGYSLNGVEKEPAIDKLMKLRSSRDYKSAHGRIGANRKSTFYELMDFQELARYLVMASVEHHTGVRVFSPKSVSS